MFLYSHFIKKIECSRLRGPLSQMFGQNYILESFYPTDLENSCHIYGLKIKSRVYSGGFTIISDQVKTLLDL